MDQHLGADQW